MSRIYEERHSTNNKLECKICGKYLNPNMFFFDKFSHKKIRECRDCLAIKSLENREVREKNLSKRVKKYGITVGDFYAMLDAQSGRCWICSREDVILHIDHCHISGDVRALLCSQCNSMLGMAADSIDTLETAIKYLKLHSFDIK